MPNNQQNRTAEGDDVRRPPILIVLLVFVVLQLLISIVVVVLVPVWGYIGFDQSNSKITQDQGCSSAYLNTKYSENTNNITISTGFVVACLWALFSFIFFLLALKSVAKRREVEEDIIIQKHTHQDGFISLLLCFVGMTMAKAWYIVESLALMMVTIVFGYYLSYYIDIVNGGCSFAYTSLQVLVIFGVSGGGLLLGIIIWILIVCILKKLKSEYDEHEVTRKYQLKSEQKASSKAKSNKEPNKHSERKYENYGQINETEMNVLDKEDKKQYISHQDKDNYKRTSEEKHEPERNDVYRSSIYYNNSGGKNKESRISRYREQSREEENHDSHVENSFGKSRFRKYQNNDDDQEFRNTEKQYVEHHANSKILGNYGEAHTQSRINSNYRQEESNFTRERDRRPLESGIKRKKRGILSDYIYGKSGK